MNDTQNQVPIKQMFSDNPLKSLSMKNDYGSTQGGEVILRLPRRSGFNSKSDKIKSSEQSFMVGNDRLNQSSMLEDYVLVPDAVLLDLSDKKLAQYVTSIKQSTSLTSLNISRNFIKELPIRLNNLHPFLLELDVSNNLITELSTLPTQLQSLKISYNLISKLPQAYPRSLTTLHIIGNPFVTLSYVENLTELAIEWGIYIGWKSILVGKQLLLFYQWWSSSLQKNFEDMVQYFMNGKFDYQQKDLQSRNLIHQAALAQHLSIIASCHKLVNINEKDQNLMTPLTLSIKNQIISSADYLLKVGANPNMGTVLIMALLREDDRLFKLLVQAGANPNRQDSDGNTAMHHLFGMRISSLNNIELVKILLQNGACCNIKNDLGYTPLHIGIKSKYVEIVRFALQYSASCFINSKCWHPYDTTILTADFTSPIQLSVDHNCPEITQLLLSKTKSYSQCFTKLLRCHNKRILQQLVTGEQNEGKELTATGKCKQDYCYFQAQQQLIKPFSQINIPNQLVSTMMSGRNYFSEQLSLKCGDNEQLEFQENSINSQEELQISGQCKNTHQELIIGGAGHTQTPYLSIENKDQQWSQITDRFQKVADEHLRGFLLSDSLEQKQLLFIILLKLNLQFSINYQSHFSQNNNKPNAALSVLKQLFEVEFMPPGSLGDEESSVQQEFNCIDMKQFEFSFNHRGIQPQQQNTKYNPPDITAKQQYLDANQIFMEYLIQILVRNKSINVIYQNNNNDIVLFEMLQQVSFHE